MYLIPWDGCLSYGVLMLWSSNLRDGLRTVSIKAFPRTFIAPSRYVFNQNQLYLPQVVCGLSVAKAG